MPSTKSRRPFSFSDEIGVACVSVPLAHTDATAIIWKIDYDRIKALGVSPNWRIEEASPGLKEAVVSRHPTLGLLSIANAVLASESGHRKVRHINGDQLDVRRPNLVSYIKK